MNCVTLPQSMHNYVMAYQFKREPLSQDEANRRANAVQTAEEKLVVWTLLDTGLCVSELASLTRDTIDWQGHRIRKFTSPMWCATLSA